MILVALRSCISDRSRAIPSGCNSLILRKLNFGTVSGSCRCFDTVLAR